VWNAPGELRRRCLEKTLARAQWRPFSLAISYSTLGFLPSRSSCIRLEKFSKSNTAWLKHATRFDLATFFHFQSVVSHNVAPSSGFAVTNRSSSRSLPVCCSFSIFTANRSKIVNWIAALLIFLRFHHLSSDAEENRRVDPN